MNNWSNFNEYPKILMRLIMGLIFNEYSEYQTPHLDPHIEARQDELEDRVQKIEKML